MQIQMKKIKLLWRTGLAVAGVLAASTAMIADTTWGLGLTVGTPHIVFDGSSSSRISYDGSGGLAVDASATILTSPTGETMVAATMSGGPFALNATGGCDTGFYALDANGQNPACWTDVGYGTFKIRATVDPNGNVIGGAAASQPDACGVVGGGSDFCITGALLSCPSSTSSPHQIQDCFNQGAAAQYQFVSPQGVLLTGQVKTSASLGTGVFANIYRTAMGAPTDGPFGVGDGFEFLLQLSGGPISGWYSTVSASDPRKFIDVEAQGCPVGLALPQPSGCDANNGSTTAPTISTDGFKTILWSTTVPGATTAFNEVVEGGADSVKMFPFLLPFDKCNGSISGVVTDFFNPGTGIPGAEVQISGQPNSTTAANGSYSAANLCGGGIGNAAGKVYTVTVVPPTGYTINGSNSQLVAVVTDASGNDSIVSNVNFQMYAQAVNTANYTTFAQAAWGTKPKGQNAGALLATYFSFVYPTGLTIGGKYTIIENSALAVQDFLPQEGLPMPLTGNYVDPTSRALLQFKGRFAHHRKLGSLAGETLALELNVRFSADSLTRPGLGNLKLTTGLLKGQTVNQVLQTANNVLGGAPIPAPLKKYDDLEDIVEHINKNFQAGTVNNGYLQ